MEFFENVVNINTIVGNDLKKIIEQIEQTGQAILIVRGKQPIVKLVPQKKKDLLEMDPTAPLPESDWPDEWCCA